ncbi:hypothetical protein CDD80_7309 [Ophiocordyceps camponoti-rufipedis]|uniref:Guanine nucleotide exchange factor synembryn n=1 Tax=Ophiocordyceps camponoti-rufipedis TaxID=2004952 RepID=A0A2C5ZLV4_9HYPO|nr:hypothetical protein CDD80_7309 [Ophiocordyceps camponoti-rufipedis]
MAEAKGGPASGPAKLEAVKDLVTTLTNDLENITLLPQDRIEALEQLKVYGRDTSFADPIYTKEGITMLLRHAFYSPSSETARAALRVLANAMLLKPETRQMFVDQGFPPRACSELKVDNWDNELLISRVLFLSTYGTNVDLLELIEKHRLAEHIIENLSRHAKLLSSKSKSTVDPMEELALLETLKLLFNVTHYCKEKMSSFNCAVPHIVALFWKQNAKNEKPLDAPFGQLVNALLNLDLGADQSRSCFELESIVTPLVGLIGKFYENAPEAVRQHLQEALLPSDEDRQAILGRGQTLSARLLKNSTNPIAPALRDAISHLFFDLSGRDANKFVQNVGYGFASGFLFQNNMPVPASASEAFSTGDASAAPKRVNPITGQFLDQEKTLEDSNMTQEEKQREAERLFVLFERLKASGIADIKNPVETALQEGRFQELDDDDSE